MAVFESFILVTRELELINVLIEQSNLYIDNLLHYKFLQIPPIIYNF